MLTDAVPDTNVVKLLQLVPPFLLYWQFVSDSDGVIVRRVELTEAPLVVVIADLVTVKVTERFLFPVTVNRAELEALAAMVVVAERFIVPKGSVVVVLVTVITCPTTALSMSIIIDKTIIHVSHRRSVVSEAISRFSGLQSRHFDAI